MSASKSELKLDWATHEAAKYACQRWHYSRRLPVGKLVKVGVWERGQFIGVVIFSRGANKSLGKPWGLQQTEICELTRIALRAHENRVSRIIKIAMRFLARHVPKIRLVVSFADPEQGHHGGVYQAAGWSYVGMSNEQEEYIYKGRRYHGRAFRKLFGSHTQYLGKGLRIVMGTSKHRYVKAMDDGMKAVIKPAEKRYPKRTKHAMAEPIGTAAVEHRPVRSTSSEVQCWQDYAGKVAGLE